MNIKIVLYFCVYILIYIYIEILEPVQGRVLFFVIAPNKQWFCGLWLGYFFRILESCLSHAAQSGVQMVFKIIRQQPVGYVESLEWDMNSLSRMRSWYVVRWSHLFSRWFSELPEIGGSLQSYITKDVTHPGHLDHHPGHHPGFWSSIILRRRLFTWTWWGMDWRYFASPRGHGEMDWLIGGFRREKPIDLCT